MMQKAAGSERWTTAGYLYATSSRDNQLEWQRNDVLSTLGPKSYPHSPTQTPNETVWDIDSVTH